MCVEGTARQQVRGAEGTSAGQGGGRGLATVCPQYALGALPLPARGCMLKTQTGGEVVR